DLLRFVDIATILPQYRDRPLFRRCRKTQWIDKPKRIVVGAGIAPRSERVFLHESSDLRVVTPGTREGEVGFVILRLPSEYPSSENTVPSPRCNIAKRVVANVVDYLSRR